MYLLRPATSEVVKQDLIEYCCKVYQMDQNGFHGYAHWMRVLHNGRLLAKAEGANIKVLEPFCLIHDTQRQNENVDPKHGYRAAQFAKTLKGIWFDADDKEMELLEEALAYHSDGYTEGDITVQVCWDADRLDLGRVGIKPIPSRLCTHTAQSAHVLTAAHQRSVIVQKLDKANL